MTRARRLAARTLIAHTLLATHIHLYVGDPRRRQRDGMPIRILFLFVPPLPVLLRSAFPRLRSGIRRRRRRELEVRTWLTTYTYRIGVTYVSAEVVLEQHSRPRPQEAPNRHRGAREEGRRRLRR